MKKKKVINTNSSSTKKNPKKLSFTTQESENEIKLFKETIFESSQKKQNIFQACNKLFSTTGNKRNHILTIHQNYRPFKRTFPGYNKRYSIESQYQVDLITHNGEKPFICKICNKTFNEKKEFKNSFKISFRIKTI